MSTPHSEGVKSGVLAAGTLLADTGPLAADTYSLAFWVSVSVSGNVKLARRNAANDADVWSMQFDLSAAQPVILQTPIGLAASLDERFTLTLVASVIGETQAILFI